ncbi:hypothetical protein [Rhizobium sp. MHM7A]|uniref:hypothetical protein n=1 Tax=Rhizobium sp. MHM7A TaxID=2583233 RepID=UPI0011059381|nr:hypothetical protein [Rhizobium sp. MHM7A]TLX17084.1 hypothetical protein FFR93_07155 [Rhizobium sp. MHM7A]
MNISPEELEKHVRESHRLALAGDMEASHAVLTDLISDEKASFEDMRPLMDKVDPLRVVWNGSVASDATGLRGLPLIEAKYILASNVYGHDIKRVHGDPDAHEAFINACEEGYDNGPLHGSGHVVVECETGRYLFLVTEVIDEEPVEPEDVAKIGEAYGVESALMAFNHEPLESGGKPGQVCLTAAIERAEQFGLIRSISNDFSELVRSTSPSNKM